MYSGKEPERQKNRDLYQGKKGAQNPGEEGKYRSTATTTTATGLAAVLAAVVRMQKTVSRMAGNGGQHENSWFGRMAP